ncbi:glucose-6-phosphate isomerase [Candidatus Peregrinibacteria bacterium]|nr:glucose-6-phosphate isomerase [Candidatus Peregrinibacteria bacterium]
MVVLDIINLDKISPIHGLSEEDLKEPNLKKILERIHNRKQGFYKIIDDAKQIKAINLFAAKNKFKDIVVLGIGGSAMGASFLQQSLKHLFENELSKNTFPRLHVLDNIDPVLMREIEDILDYKKTLFIVITKSGETMETLSQYLYFREKCEKKKLKIKDHFVFITDPKKGLIRKISNEEKIKCFDIPESVGGRFSVLTPVGLLPARLIGINIEKILAGAKKMRKIFLSENVKENLPFRLAKIEYILGRKGKTTIVLMPYAQKLIRLADWYRQLLAESIGKKFNNRGEEVYTGLTPINALGVTDQHSQLQLYSEGPNDKLIIFMEILNQMNSAKIPNPKKTEPETEVFKNTSFNKLMKAEKKATEESLTTNNRPNITVKIEIINEETIGELTIFFEASIAFLGELYNINAFNQPGVELSKKLTKKYLCQ